MVSAPFTAFVTPVSKLLVTTVAGIAVAANPDGSFTVPDVTIDSAVPVPVEIEARNVPTGTVVQLHLLSENVADQVVDAPPLAGTDALSTTTVIVTIPSGFTRGVVRGTWAP